MEAEKYSGQELVNALQENSLRQPLPELIVIVKKSDKANHVALSQLGCDQWLHIPTELIREAVQVGWRSCGDHGHPVMNLRVKEPSSGEANLFYGLWQQAQHQGRGSGIFPPVDANRFRDCYKYWRDRGFSWLTSVISCL